ncbi:S6 family peptidase (plasmid) [Escherichia coli]
MYNNQGEFVGALDRTTLPDFISANSGCGMAILINPQYITSVKHYGEYIQIPAWTMVKIVTISWIRMTFLLWFLTIPGRINSLRRLI